MRIIKGITFMMLVSLAAAWAGCRSKGGETTLTVAQRMARTWRVSRALVNGQQDNTGNYTAFRIAFQVAGTAPSNYTVTPGSAPAKPNLSPTNTGVWVLESTDTRIVLDKGSANESALTIVDAVTEQNLKIRWKVPRTVDKTEPEYTFELVPVQ